MNKLVIVSYQPEPQVLFIEFIENLVSIDEFRKLAQIVDNIEQRDVKMLLDCGETDAGMKFSGNSNSRIKGINRELA